MKNFQIIPFHCKQLVIQLMTFKIHSQTLILQNYLRLPEFLITCINTLNPLRNSPYFLCETVCRL